MQKITPFLWFDKEAEEAARFYVSIFKNAKIGHDLALWRRRSGAEGERHDRLLRARRLAVHGPERRPGLSLHAGHLVLRQLHDPGRGRRALGQALRRRRQPQQCGWLKDKFGLSWQIIPATLMELMSDPDPVKSQRVMQAMLQMTKIDIAALKQAYAG